MDKHTERGNRLAAFAGQLGGKLGVAVSIVGFGVIFLGWNGAASFNDLRQQFPYLISGGIAGLALVVVGTALLLIEAARAERAELQSSIEDLRRAIESLGAASSNGHGATGTPSGSDDLVVAGTSSFHQQTCRLVAGREQMVMLTAADAGAQGLAACRICNPAADAPGRSSAR